MSKQDQCGHGFTLIEVLLSLAIIAIIIGITAPVYQILQNRTNLAAVANVLSQSFNRARILSQSGYYDSSWGVKIQTSTITVFQGGDYLSRMSSTDEVYEIPENLTISGLDEVVFSKLDGYPLIFGTTTLISPSGDFKNLYINAKGFVSY